MSVLQSTLGGLEILVHKVATLGTSITGIGSNAMSSRSLGPVSRRGEGRSRLGGLLGGLEWRSGGSC